MRDAEDEARRQKDKVQQAMMEKLIRLMEEQDARAGGSPVHDKVDKDGDREEERLCKVREEAQRYARDATRVPFAHDASRWRLANAFLGGGL